MRRERGLPPGIGLIKRVSVITPGDGRGVVVVFDGSWSGLMKNGYAIVN